MGGILTGAKAPMDFKIHGTTLQSLEVILQPGEAIYSQTHQMAWMTDGTSMDTNTGGGLLKGLVRSLSGGSLFLTHFTAAGASSSLVAFCPKFPGTIVARQLVAGESIICRKEAFLCAEKSVELSVYFRQQIAGGLLGGEGFIMQKVAGPGWVYLDLSGEVVEKTLLPGERLRVHVGHLGIQDESVQFGITRISGFRNAIFGGDGMYVATLTGPGRIYLQSMPIINLAEEIFRYAPSKGG